MTTLVYDGKTLASDSQATQESVVMLAQAKKIYEPGPGEYWEIMGVKVLAMAIAGDPDMLPWAIDALNNGVTHKTDFGAAEVNFISILVDETGLGWLWGCSRMPKRGLDNYIMSPITGVLAAGSGQVLANALLSVGLTAPDVIERVSKLDIFTGGDVQTWEFPGKPAVPSKRPVPETLPAPLDPRALSPEQLDQVVAAIQKKDREQNPPLTDEQRAEIVANAKEKVLGEMDKAFASPVTKPTKKKTANV